MSAAPKNLVRFLCASAAVILLAAALNFVVDPLQYFRPARLFHAMYSPDSRMQNAGLIHSQHYDTVFMGTSLAIHFRQSDIDRILGGRSVKLAMTGSNSHEQSFVLDAALARHPKRVLWQMDDWIFRDAPEIDADIYLTADLYRRNARGIASYLFSGAMARESLWILARSIPPLEKIVARLTTGVVFKFPYANIDDVNTLNAKLDPSQIYNTNAMLAAFTRATAAVRNSYLAEGYNNDEMVRNFERDAVGLIEKHPDVEFDIYFPPYSILQFVAMRDFSPATLQIVYKANDYMLRRLAQFPNVKVYDFREAKEITHDLNNYSDMIHHSPAIDLKVLALIAADRYRMDRAAPEASLDRLKSQIEAYRIGEVER
jgi:hypothetical protein